MSRIPIVAGNWKMNPLHDEALALARALREQADAITGVEKIVCPPFVFLHEVSEILKGSTIKVGAQNLYPEEKGAFTGEISVSQVAETAAYAIIGHSERRQYFGETDATVNHRIASDSTSFAGNVPRTPRAQDFSLKPSMLSAWLNARA